jgi:hypothetical protein
LEIGAGSSQGLIVGSEFAIYNADRPAFQSNLGAYRQNLTFARVTDVRADSATCRLFSLTTGFDRSGRLTTTEVDNAGGMYGRSRPIDRLLDPSTGMVIAKPLYRILDAGNDYWVGSGDRDYVPPVDHTDQVFIFPTRRPREQMRLVVEYRTWFESRQTARRAVSIEPYRHRRVDGFHDTRQFSQSTRNGHSGQGGSGSSLTRSGHDPRNPHGGDPSHVGPRNGVNTSSSSQRHGTPNDQSKREEERKQNTQRLKDEQQRQRDERAKEAQKHREEQKARDEQKRRDDQMRREDQQRERDEKRKQDEERRRQAKEQHDREVQKQREEQAKRQEEQRKQREADKQKQQQGKGNSSNGKKGG